MSTATQISSFLVPTSIWAQGCHTRPDLPPLALPARDALDIEWRAQKRVNLRNESQRYILCCERIQGIVCELSQEVGILPPPIPWLSRSTSDNGLPTAMDYLALIEALSPFLRGSPYPRRISALFFPPGDAGPHLQTFEAIRQGANLDQLFERAAKNANLTGSRFTVKPGDCRRALDQRYELLKRTAAEGSGLVDVIELA